MPDVAASQNAPAISHPEILRQINALRRIDNTTNWYYLAREYLFLALVIGATIALYESFWQSLGSLTWAIPLTVATVLCVGAGQHRLATLTHEAAHYMLFRNRLLNELVSEWFCMFPLLGTTHTYRVQHLGHHQYPNDPEQDPDWTQMSRSGHRFHFPMTTGQFLWHCFLKQLLWLPNLLRYVLVRASFRVDQGTGPYRMKRRTSPALKLTILVYHLLLAGILIGCVYFADARLLACSAGGLFTALLLFLALAPQRWFPEYSIKSDLPMRWQSGLRLSFNTLFLAGVAWLTLWTGRPCWFYAFVLWIAPLGTSFAFFMVLRQIIQHGNADQERFTNTRIFLVHPLVRMAVFPIGNDYHLPHHLFMMVPHYHLRELHELLLQTAPYGGQATIVPGCVFHNEQEPQQPTILDLMTHEIGAFDAKSAEGSRWDEEGDLGERQKITPSFSRRSESGAEVAHTSARRLNGENNF